MTITSFWFWFFLLGVGVLYYLCPKKIRWTVLLVASLAFFVLACGWEMLGYLAFGTVTTYLGARLIFAAKSTKGKKWILFFTLLLVVGELAALKYVRFLLHTAGLIAGLFGAEFSLSFAGLAAPLGISYYTLSMIGYVLDVYWEKYPPQKNFLKHICLLFPAVDQRSDHPL